ncbi:hypothetical protein Poli38472_006495 [Pythium oligandrum]|uniref:Elicitin-like protein n=1 Tax=Pythium oligandrum TaxID=41045 RepID=A0A8K1C4W4_PYTOL|nr:hypothetical protein Poli38472_006495 [Pythium oligandrum]|eukprot:TMW56485.1 hypothetical protein Poli38472_006495 [Pythium oligandrum]
MSSSGWPPVEGSLAYRICEYPHFRTLHLPAFSPSMKLNTIVCTLLFATVGSVVNAGECSNKDLAGTSSLNAKLEAVCGSDAQSLFTSTGSSSLALCKKPACVEAIRGATDDLPDCTIGGLSLPAVIEATAQLCDNEANSTTTTDGSQSTSVSAGSTYCSSFDISQVASLRSESAMIKACGAEQVSTAEVASSKICSADCVKYTKETFVPALPDCTYQGVNVKTSVKMLMAYCDVTPDAAGSLTSASVAALVGLVAAVLAMA